MTEQDVLRAADEAAKRSTWKPALGNETVREFFIRFACIVADEAEQRERTRIMQHLDSAVASHRAYMLGVEHGQRFR